MPVGASFIEDVPVVGYMYLVFTHMAGKSYHLSGTRDAL